MQKPILSFFIAVLIVFSGFIVPKMAFAQNLTNPTFALGDIGLDPRNDIFASTAVIDPADLWNMSPFWLLPLLLIPLGYWFLYRKENINKEEDVEASNASRYQVSYHDIRQDHPEANEQLEDIDSWYSKKEAKSTKSKLT